MSSPLDQLADAIERRRAAEADIARLLPIVNASLEFPATPPRSRRTPDAAAVTVPIKSSRKAVAAPAAPAAEPTPPPRAPAACAEADRGSLERRQMRANKISEGHARRRAAKAQAEPAPEPKPKAIAPPPPPTVAAAQPVRRIPGMGNLVRGYGRPTPAPAPAIPDDVDAEEDD